MLIFFSKQILKDRGCEIAINSKCDSYQKGLANMV